MRPLIAILILLFAGVATAQPPTAAPVGVCHSCRPQPPGQWQPILYPTPLRSWLFGSARWQPDPNYRWQPGQWVPIQPHPTHPKQGVPQ